MIHEGLWAQHQYQVLAGFTHHLAYYRVLHKIYRNTKKESEFWTMTIDAHLLRAIIDWCMVFGADSNEIHWKRVVLGKKGQTEFRRHLFKSTGMTRHQWQSYWLSMTRFRNEFAAHKKVDGEYPPVPMMNRALRVVTIYDDWLRMNIQAIFAEPSLQARYKRLSTTIERTLVKAVNLGPWVSEEYEGNPPS